MNTVMLSKKGHGIRLTATSTEVAEYISNDYKIDWFDDGKPKKYQIRDGKFIKIN